MNYFERDQRSFTIGLVVIIVLFFAFMVLCEYASPTVVSTTTQTMMLTGPYIMPGGAVEADLTSRGGESKVVVSGHIVAVLIEVTLLNPAPEGRREVSVTYDTIRVPATSGKPATTRNIFKGWRAADKANMW